MRNEVPFISFTFDDFPRSALASGGAILRRYGLNGTYYVSLGLMGQNSPSGVMFEAEDLKSLLAAGHEIGCHTFAHCHSWDTSPAYFERSIIENRRALDELLPRATFKSFSYPISWPRPRIKSLAARNYRCCRGGDQTFNSELADPGQLYAYFLDERTKTDFHAIEQIIVRNRQARGWLIFATHDVCESPSSYGCTPAFFEKVIQRAIASKATILPVAEAWDAIRPAEH